MLLVGGTSASCLESSGLLHCSRPWAFWQVSYRRSRLQSASSGEPAGDVLFAWPGWGVQQDLGPLGGTVGTFEISLSAEPGGDELTVFATLIDATTREVVRAWTIEATPGYTPVTRVLAFPGYSVPRRSAVAAPVSGRGFRTQLRNLWSCLSSA